MRDFHKWIIEEGFWDGLGNAMRKGADFLSPAPVSPPPPPAATPTPDPPPPAPPNPNDDLETQKTKFKMFFKYLILGFKKYIPDIDNNAAIKEHLKNIARAFTLGRRVEVRYLDELLIAIHQDHSILPVYKTSTFSDHYKLLRYIREIYESKSSLWYDKNEKYSIHPDHTIHKSDLENLVHQWSRSPNRYKIPKAEPKSKRSNWSSHEVQEFFKDLYRKHVESRKRVGGGYDRIEITGIQLMHLAKQNDIELTQGDFDLILAKINGE